MANRATIAKVLVVLTAAYPTQSIPKETPAVYADLLADIPDDLLLMAAKHHASTSKWFPKIAELREAAAELKRRATGLPTAAEALGEVTRQVGAIGSWGMPTWSTPQIGQVIDALGGWVKFCQSENGMADRAHFIRLYESLLVRVQRDDVMLPDVRAAIETLAGRLAVPQLEGER